MLALALVGCQRAKPEGDAGVRCAVVLGILQKAKQPSSPLTCVRRSQPAGTTVYVDVALAPPMPDGMLFIRTPEHDYLKSGEKCSDAEFTVIGAEQRTMKAHPPDALDILLEEESPTALRYVVSAVRFPANGKYHSAMYCGAATGRAFFGGLGGVRVLPDFLPLPDGGTGGAADAGE